MDWYFDIHRQYWTNSVSTPGDSYYHYRRTQYYMVLMTNTRLYQANGIAIGFFFSREKKNKWIILVNKICNIGKLWRCDMVNNTNILLGGGGGVSRLIWITVSIYRIHVLIAIRMLKKNSYWWRVKKSIYVFYTEHTVAILIGGCIHRVDVKGCYNKVNI